MKVKRLPMDPGTAGWNAILPPGPPYPELDEARTADWLVIGAGFAGLAAALRLRQLHHGDTIAVLEARRIAQGPAGRNSGFMIDLPHELTSDDYAGALDRDRKLTRMNRAAIDFAADAADKFGLAGEAFSRSGKINAAATGKGLHHNESYAKHLTALGEQYRLLDSVEMRELCGSTYYKGGLFTPGTAMIQPALFVRGLASGLTEENVRIYEHSPVTALGRQGGTWRATTPTGSIEAPKIILAVNGHAESFGHFKRRLIHIYLYASMTRALTRDEMKTLGGEQVWGFTPADPLGSTVRRISGTGGDRIVVRNRVTYNPSMRSSEATLARMAKSHDKSFAARFPILGNVEMEHRWGGQLCLSWNSAPAFGEVDDSLYSACCQNGLGTTKGTFSGMMAAELASGRSSPLLDDIQSEPTPQALPPEPFTRVGATARMKWGEWQAGAEL